MNSPQLFFDQSHLNYLRFYVHRLDYILRLVYPSSSIALYHNNICISLTFPHLCSGKLNPTELDISDKRITLDSSCHSRFKYLLSARVCQFESGNEVITVDCWC
jgi:hypothetical protein